MRTKTLPCCTSPLHLLCHSDRTGDANLVDAFLIPDPEGRVRPRRRESLQARHLQPADRGTEGLVIAAKNYACGHERDHPHRPAGKGILHSSRWVSQSGRGSPHGGSTTRRTTRSASTPINRRTSAASRSSRTGRAAHRRAFCPVQDRPCHRPHPSDLVQYLAHLQSRCWAISNTATAR